MRRLVIQYIALVVVGTTTGADSVGNAPVGEVKAALMVNFAEYVEWPPGAFPGADSAIILGVMGETAIDDDLERLHFVRVNGRRIEIRRFKGELEFLGESTPGRRQDDWQARRAKKFQELKGCHLLFISKSEQDYLKRILDRLRGQSILTVGESADFIERGGVINFVTYQGRIQFEVNLEAAREARLNISSKLLQLARLVHTGGADPNN